MRNRSLTYPRVTCNTLFTYTRSYPMFKEMAGFLLRLAARTNSYTYLYGTWTKWYVHLTCRYKCTTKEWRHNNVITMNFKQDIYHNFYLTIFLFLQIVSKILEQRFYEILKTYKILVNNIRYLPGYRLSI